MVVPLHIVFIIQCLLNEITENMRINDWASLGIAMDLNRWEDRLVSGCDVALRRWQVVEAEPITALTHGCDATAFSKSSLLKLATQRQDLGVH